MPDVSLGRTQGLGIVWPGGSSLQGPHRVGAFSTCPQYEAFAHDLELRANVEKEALVIGTLVHVGLAYRYAMMMPREQWPTWLVYKDGREAIWICGHETPDYATEALRVFDAYQAHYAHNVITPVAVEHQFIVELDIGNGSKEPYSCRTDLLGIENGQYVIYDHKVFRSISRYTGYEYRADRQMLTNLWLARAHGYDVQRVVLNTMTKDQPTPRFCRYDIPISHKAFADLWRDTHYWLLRMNETRKVFPDPMDRPKVLEACTRKYGRCQYQSLCHEGLHTIVEYKKRTDK